MVKKIPFPVYVCGLVLPFLLLYIGSVVYIQDFLNSTFNFDQFSYQRAAALATKGHNPYLPFQIPFTYVYPPAILPLFAFFNSIPFDLARVIWTDISVVAYLATLAVIWYWLKPAPTFRTLLIFGLLILYGPLSENLTVGQVDCLVLLGLTVLVWSQDGHKLGWLGGVGLALATLIKFTPGMLGLVLLWHRNWKRSGQTVLAGLVLASVSVWAFGIGVWQDFLQIVPKLVVTGSSDSNNQRITNTLAWFFKTSEANPTIRLYGSLFSFGIIAAWLVVLVFRSHPHNPVPITLLGVVTMTISSSLIWYHHFLFLILPILYMLFKYKDSGLVWLGWASLGAIQLDRALEHAYKWPPIMSQLGYLTIWVALLIVAWQSKTVPKFIRPAYNEAPVETPNPQAEVLV